MILKIAENVWDAEWDTVTLISPKRSSVSIAKH